MLRDLSQIPNRHQSFDHLEDDGRLRSRRLRKMAFGLAFTDLSITVASVATVSGGICKDFNAGATITAGKSLYLDANNLWQLAQSDSAAHLGSGSRTGVALHAALNGQPLAVQETGILNPGGAILTIGTIYVISAANAGGIAPFADLASTNKIHILGIGKTTSQLDMAYKSAYPNGYTGLTVP